MKYVIVSAENLETLSEQVNAMIQQHWEPHGGLTAIAGMAQDTTPGEGKPPRGNPVIWFLQAMTRSLPQDIPGFRI